MDDLISRQAAIDALWKALYEYEDETEKQFLESEELDVGEWIGHRIFVQNMNDIDRQTILNLPSAQPERLTDDDFETIRIHLNAYKEKLCNQQRWKEAEEYQRIIDRFMAFASAQPERIKGHWVEIASSNHTYKCSVCGRLLVNITDGRNNVSKHYPYCHCGADMRGEQDG